MQWWNVHGSCTEMAAFMKEVCQARDLARFSMVHKMPCLVASDRT